MILLLSIGFKAMKWVTNLVSIACKISPSWNSTFAHGLMVVVDELNYHSWPLCYFVHFIKCSSSSSESNVPHVGFRIYDDNPLDELIVSFEVDIIIHHDFHNITRAIFLNHFQKVTDVFNGGLKCPLTYRRWLCGWNRQRSWWVGLSMHHVLELRQSPHISSSYLIWLFHQDNTRWSFKVLETRS